MNQFPFTASESSSTWGSTSDLAAPFQGYLDSVSCVDVNDCVGVGDDSSNQSGFVSVYSSGSWGTYQDLYSPSFDGDLNGVSCSDAMDCTAVGEDSGGVNQPYFITESSGSWGTATDVSTPSGSGSFTAISCPDSMDCTAVGQDGNDQPMYEVEYAGVWTPIAVDIGAIGTGAGFDAVSCPDSMDCTAVGVDASSKTLLRHRNGWRVGTTHRDHAVGINRRRLVGELFQRLELHAGWRRLRKQQGVLRR